MFLSVYQTKVNYLKAKKMQGFDTSKQEDALQNAASELFEHAFGNIKQAEKLLNKRYKSRLIDLYRKDDKLDFVSDFVGHIVPEQPKEDKICPDKLEILAESILNQSEYETFCLFLEGWSGSEIAEMFKVKRAAISKRLSRIIGKLKVNELIIELTEVAL